MERGLVVSCQAFESEPLHSCIIMGRMAKAAKEGGAVAIRANGIADILEIKKQVDLPIIGIIKKNYPQLVPYITPTIKEVDELVNAGVDIIALDATANQSEAFLTTVAKKYPMQKFMADISTLGEGIRADNLGFEYIGTTLIGYTNQSEKLDKFEVLQALINNCRNKVIAEGNFNTPEQAAKAIEMGAYAVVVGSAITRPQIISRWFFDAISKKI